MANTPEALVKKQIKAILTKNNAYYAMPIGTGYGNSGVPDFLICHGGRFIAIEAKAGNNKPTALQEAHLERIKKAWGIAHVINEDNLSLLEEILNGTNRS
jgi:pantoate kinase